VLGTPVCLFSFLCPSLETQEAERESPARVFFLPPFSEDRSSSRELQSTVSAQEVNAHQSSSVQNYPAGLPAGTEQLPEKILANHSGIFEEVSK